MKSYKILLIGLVCGCFVAAVSWAELNPQLSGEKAKFDEGQRVAESVEKSASSQDAVKAKDDSSGSVQPIESKAVLIEGQESSEQNKKDQKESKPGQETIPGGQSQPEEKKAGELATPSQTPAPESLEVEASGNAKNTTMPANANTLTFNFDDADLREVIRTLADLLQINYLIDPKVGGKVTIHTAGELKRKDLLPIFYQILDVNGLTAVKEGNLYKIITAKEAPRMPIPSCSGQDNKAALEGEEIIIQIIPLNSISADEMSKILTPFVSADGVVVTHADSNTVLVIDRPGNISKILRLVDAFDSDVFERVHYRFYPLKFGDAPSLVDILTQMSAAYGSALKTNIAFISIERLNTVLVVSTNSKAFDEISDFVKNYDVPSENAEQTIFIYPVKNGQAREIAEILNSVFKGKSAAKKEEKKKYGNPLDRNTKMAKTDRAKPKEPPAQPSAQPAAQPVETSKSGADVSAGMNSLRGEVNITADELRNSLIIQASPIDYQIVKNLLVHLDVMPRQVLIEVSIAEITLDNKTDMGVEWAYKKAEGNLSTSLLSAKAGSSGLTFTIGDATHWTAVLSALATQNKVNILSSPSVLASNGISASIDISTEIPVATSSYQYTTVENPVLSTDIEYRDTGVMLNVTPHINEFGLVTMEIQQEVSEQADNVSVGDVSYPSFFKRSAQTTLTVQSGQTIVIGGLIKETKSNGASGTPWFVSVPVLNFLFGKTSNSVSKTELMILISPYVIAQMDEVDAVTKDFKGKLDMLFPEMKKTPVNILEQEKQGK